MGVIYKAYDPDIDRPVAIKLVRADLLAGAEREDYVARFRREARAAGRCVHPNIVAIHDFAIHEGNPFLAMEYVEGASLAQLLERGTRFTPAQAVAVIGQVLEALACAHGLGVVHRDIKPANVMLLADRRVKVTDFGISRIEGSDLTDAGSVLGTPSAMSPEQCLGQPIDERSDLFSAGAILYLLLSGERPFAGRSIAEITHKLLSTEPPDLAPRIGARLARVVSRALAKRPADRFATAVEMRQALLAAMGPDDAGTVVIAPARAALLSEAETERMTRALARHLGPIAKVLVRRAVRQARTRDALWADLADHIDSAAERAAFLRECAR